MPAVGLETDQHTVQGFAMEISVSRNELLREPHRDPVRGRA